MILVKNFSQDHPETLKVSDNIKQVKRFLIQN